MTPYYERDGIVIYHGDCLQVLESMENDSVGVVFTDPPYSSGARNSAALRSRKSMRREGGAYGQDEWIGGDNLTARYCQLAAKRLDQGVLKLEFSA